MGKTLVIKVGTSTLTLPSGRLHLQRLDRLARLTAELTSEGNRIALVTSGAIGVGQQQLRLPGRPADTAGKQVAAAVGQCALMNMYSRFFADYGYPVGQVLLTRDITTHETGRQHCVNTLRTCFEMGVIPIVNENDTVSVEEISPNEFTFGENDTLAAVVGILIEADEVIVLSDVDGLYDRDPRLPGAQRISVVEEITPGMRRAAGGPGTGMGTGGMVTKLDAAALATRHGMDFIIAPGEDPLVVWDVLAGKDIGTRFKRRKES
ncbi:MAG: glutamate 5-kinase [Christensenellales bacterium]|jgi:glutamate 5-kinase